MSIRRLLAASAFLVAASSPAAAQTVLDFEDLAGQGVLAPTYGGIDWMGSGWMHYGFAQHPFTASSGTQRVYRHASVNQFGFVAGTASFGGAYFAGASTVRFELFLDGALVHTSEVLALSATPTFLASGYAGAVDRVDMHVGSGTQWVMDDVQFALGASPTVTPEPASVALVGLGLAGLGGVAARRRRTLPS